MVKRQSIHKKSIFVSETSTVIQFGIYTCTQDFHLGINGRKFSFKVMHERSRKT